MVLRSLRRAATVVFASLYRSQTSFVGDFADWSAAKRASVGYGAEEIAERALRAALKVKEGEAAYERDTVLFSSAEYSFPVVTGLLLAALAEERHLRVLDFGGAFGSSYFQNRGLLQQLEELRWGIVEQESFVARGREHIADNTLRFYSSIEGCLNDMQPNFILLSSVLNYLPEPLTLLNQLAGLGARFICLDRTLVALQGRSRLTVQIVPPEIYEASYPCWILREEELLAPLRSAYRRVYQFSALGGDVALDGLAGAFRGYLFVRADVPAAAER